jgi:alpha-methylacyl-CoA racemase
MSPATSRDGPLQGLKVLEFAGIGPGPFCAMLLSDLGADVVRIARADQQELPVDLLLRGRRSMVLDLKSANDLAACLAMIDGADVLIEGFRPGVMERLGLGPSEAHARNPRLIYSRMTGWGQEGPLARTAGHDINYIALTGALAATGFGEGPPVPPLNLVGDFGGGSLYLAFGIMAAIHERSLSGKGQVVDAAIVDGAASMMTQYVSLSHSGYTGRRGEYLLDGSAPYYRCYECSDGRYVAVGAIEPHFYRVLVERLGRPDLAEQPQPADWPAAGRTLAALFRTRPRDEWTEMMDGSDACFAPVLEIDEASQHPHMAARQAFTTVEGVAQPAPAPRFSRTPGRIQSGHTLTPTSPEQVLADWLPSKA